MVEKRWPNFRKAFVGFSPEMVAKLTEKDVKTLMRDEGIVRNERKIRATIHNAGEFVSLKKEFGSFKGYAASFGKDRGRLQKELQEKVQHFFEGRPRGCFSRRSGTRLLPRQKRSSSWQRTRRDGRDQFSATSVRLESRSRA